MNCRGMQGTCKPHFKHDGSFQSTTPFIFFSQRQRWPVLAAREQISGAARQARRQFLKRTGKRARPRIHRPPHQTHFWLGHAEQRKWYCSGKRWERYPLRPAGLGFGQHARHGCGLASGARAGQYNSAGSVCGCKGSRPGAAPAGLREKLLRFGQVLEHIITDANVGCAVF